MNLTYKELQQLIKICQIRGLTNISARSRRSELESELTTILKALEYDFAKTLKGKKGEANFLASIKKKIGTGKEIFTESEKVSLFHIKRVLPDAGVVIDESWWETSFPDEYIRVEKKMEYELAGKVRQLYKHSWVVLPSCHSPVDLFLFNGQRIVDNHIEKISSFVLGRSEDMARHVFCHDFPDTEINTCYLVLPAYQQYISRHAVKYVVSGQKFGPNLIYLLLNQLFKGLEAKVVLDSDDSFSHTLEVTLLNLPATNYSYRTVVMILDELRHCLRETVFVDIYNQF